MEAWQQRSTSTSVRIGVEREERRHGGQDGEEEQEKKRKRGAIGPRPLRQWRHVSTFFHAYVFSLLLSELCDDSVQFDSPSLVVSCRIFAHTLLDLPHEDSDVVMQLRSVAVAGSGGLRSCTAAATATGEQSGGSR